MNTKPEFAAVLVALLLTPAWAEPEEDTVNQTGPYPRGPFSGPTQGIFTLGEDEGFGLGPSLADPSAFDGSNRTETVLEGSRFVDNFGLTGRYGTYLTPRQRLMVTATAGVTNMCADLDYSFIPEGTSGYFSAYLNQTRSQNASYLSGSPEIGLGPGNSQPWLSRSCAGFGYTTDPSQRFILSSALVYENVRLLDNAFGNRVAPYDSLGNPLTVSPGGTDRMLLVRTSAAYLDVNDLQFPTDGDKVGFSAEQAIPIGASPINLTRFNVNYSHFQALGDPTLIFNVQAGTQMGLVPPYEAYNLGGFNSVRGYQLGELGGGTSFLQASTELRIPLGSLSLFETDVPFRINLFSDYGTALGTASRVFGSPALVRDKRDSGLGYGAGIQAVTSFGLIRLEAGFADEGRRQFSLSIGDRY